MLTPQLLASLNAQQLHAMKNNPQFQEMIRQFKQRQEAMQQQQQQQQGKSMLSNIQQQQSPHGLDQMHSGPPTFQQDPSMQMSREQALRQQQQQQQQQQMLMNQQHMVNPMNQNLAQQQTMPLQSPHPSQQPQQQPQQSQQSQQSQEAPYKRGVPNQVSPPTVSAQNMGIPGGLPMNKIPSRMPSIPGVPAVVGGASASPSMGASGIPTGINMPMGNMNATPAPNMSPGNQQIPPNQFSRYPQLQQTNPNVNLSFPAVPPSAQNLLSKVPMKQLASFDEWSKKLKSQGKPVPLDTEVYETTIQKDAMFLANHARQSHEHKIEVESMNKDLQHYNQIKQLRMNSIQLSAKNQMNNSIWGEGYQGYGNGITNAMTKLILPTRDYTDNAINSRVMSQDNLAKNYIPIRLEFDQERDQFKLRDTFLWDLNETILTVEDFTQQLLEDYKFIPRVHYHTIVSVIKEQIAEYQQKPLKTVGELRIPIKIDIIINNTQLTDQFEWDILNSEEGDPEEFASCMCDELYLPGEFGTAIAHSIREQTQMYLKALNAAGWNYDGTPINDENIRSHCLPALRLVSKDYQMVDDFFSILRNPTTVSDFSPQLIKLTELEVERMDKELERESRRKRRHNYNEDVQQAIGSGGVFSASSASTFGPLGSASTGSGGSRGFTSSRRTAAHTGRGTSMLDLSDIPKTFRTPAPSSILPGAVDLGVSEIYEYDEVFVNKTQIPNPDYKPPTPEPVSNDLVTYHHDPLEGTFNVTIRLLD
ncbi:uncharacterized protein LODBEIA_P35300 [Lodderomyces beijingensis]|uniref:SWI/SNF chromatin-remodeling complex subunit SNF5 n=1 Tax=Lodderomyces beijingensis TaxID=1775926 RepID=A0ABP0ZQC6_9ASCO